MANLGKMLEGPRDLARAKIMETVRTRYFPEMWYMLENWFALSKSKAILDVGCGNGLITQALAKSGWEVTAVDPVLSCLLRTQELFQQHGFEGRFEQAEPDALPFATHSFDSIVCLNAMEFAESPRRLMRELYRVLRPGGRVMIATFAKLSPWGLTSVARAVRDEPAGRSCRFLSQKDFVQTLRSSRLTIERLKGRARYLPGMTGKLTFPVTGCYVAFCSKPQKSATGEETEIRPERQKIEKD